jgi:hypothetical protein
MDIMLIEAMKASRVSALDQVYQTTRSSTAGQVDRVSSTESDETDSVTLSSEGQKALDVLSLFGTDRDEPITLDSIRSHGERQLAAFEKQFQALLRENGIDTSEPVTLGHEFGSGRVVVTNDHPDAEKIETLMQDNPALRNMYTGATNALELAKHAEAHLEFSKAYAQNPQAAVAQYSYLFNTRWDASVTFSNEGHSVAFSRVPRQ